MDSLDDISKMSKYESGQMSDREVVDLFAELIKSGAVWKLQGDYGQTAIELIEAGFIDHKGNIIVYP
jgi:hypothetical protein